MRSKGEAVAADRALQPNGASASEIASSESVQAIELSSAATSTVSDAQL